MSGQTAKERAEQVWDAWVTNEHEPTSQIIVRFAQAITEAEERGQVAMRAKCVSVLQHVADVAGECENTIHEQEYLCIRDRIRFLPTSSEEQSRASEPSTT